MKFYFDRAHVDYVNRVLSSSKGLEWGERSSSPIKCDVCGGGIIESDSRNLNCKIFLNAIRKENPGKKINRICGNCANYAAWKWESENP